jgi:hypothetical protein
LIPLDLLRIACEVQHGILRWSVSGKVFSWTIAPRRVATFRSVLVPRIAWGENLDQAVLGDFEYCCKLFEHRLLDIPKAFDTAPMLCLEMPLFAARWRA